MNSIVLSSIVFALILGGIFLGSLLRSLLPQHHLSKDSQDVIRLGVGLLATMAALVVGLLIASAKSSFDTQSGQVKQITANFILLDALLSQYGPEARPIREKIRTAIPLFADRIWQEKTSAANAPYATDPAAQDVYVDIQALTPKTDLQRSLQSRAIEVSTAAAQSRLLLFRRQQVVSAAVPRHIDAVARHHLCELQLVLGSQHDGLRVAVAVRAIGLLRDFPDPGT